MAIGYGVDEAGAVTGMVGIEFEWRHSTVRI